MKFLKALAFMIIMYVLVNREMDVIMMTWMWPEEMKLHNVMCLTMSVPLYAHGHHNYCNVYNELILHNALFI